MSVDREIKLDFQRAERIGLHEAVLCSGKSVEHVTNIVAQVEARGTSMLLTRLESTQWMQLGDSVRSRIEYEPLSRTGVVGPMPPLRTETSRVAVVCAGTSDAFVAREVERTLRFHGEPCTRVDDVGVAGLWRLLERVDELKQHAVVVVVAGMDAALPTAVGGLVPGLVIAVPTSVGYGAAMEGETALRSALVSCAQGVVVCNIDNGFGAACAALRALRIAGLALTR